MDRPRRHVRPAAPGGSRRRGEAPTGGGHGRGPSRDEGSTLLEVLVGFSLFCVVVMATSSGSIVSTAAASAAQQRAVAYTLVSGTMANATALPFSDLTAGLNSTVDSLSSDPNIQTVGSTYVLRLTGATLASTNAKSSDGPLVPHISTTTVGIPYKVATYPQVMSNSTVTLVVVVTWRTALRGTGQVVGEATVAAP
ncbi:MAG TPA: hypothetical protein VID75_14865 [Acidimicrobiales bacterium]